MVKRKGMQRGSDCHRCTYISDARLHIKTDLIGDVALTYHQL